MATTEEKKQIILEHEAWFARNLSHRVIEKPKLSIWMILIPVFFVFFMLQHQRASESRKPFVENYLKARIRALEAAARQVQEGQEPDIKTLSGLSDVPEDVREKHAEWLKTAIAHYCSLLSAKGGDFPSLVRAAYRNKTNLLLVFNRLNETEKDMDEALIPHLEKEVEDVREVVQAMQRESEKFRRKLAEEFFA